MNFNNFTGLKCALSAILVMWYFAPVKSQTFKPSTSADGQLKSNLRWSSGTEAVEVRVAVIGATFVLPFANVKAVYTSSDGTQLVNCVVVITDGSCAINNDQCSFAPGYNLVCSGNSTEFTPIMTIAVLSDKNDNNSVLDFPSTDVTGISPWSFSPLTMNVEYCDKNAFSPDASSSQPASSCGYRCNETFVCNSCTGLKFSSQCQASVVWSPSTTTTCPEGCSINDFAGRAAPVVPMAGIFQTCGNDLTFKCDSSLVCEDSPPTFTPACGLDGNWNFTNTDGICFKVCDGLMDGEKAAIGLSSVWFVLFVVLTALAFTKSADDECSIDWLTTKIISQLGCCKYWTRYWALGSTTSLVLVGVLGIVVIVTSTGGECCSLDAQAIVGISFAVLGNAVVGFFVVALFCVKTKTSKNQPHKNTTAPKNVDDEP